MPIERNDLLIGLAHLQIDLGTPEQRQPTLRLSHEQWAETRALMRRVDGEVVDPPPMAVVADHHRPDNTAVELEHEQTVFVLSELTADVTFRIIPPPEQPAGSPEGNERLPIGWVIEAKSRTVSRCHSP